MISPCYRVEHEDGVATQTPFHIRVANLDVSDMNFINKQTNLMKFSKKEHAIPVSNNIMLRTPAYYRAREESYSGGIGDKEEASYFRDLDFDAF